LKKAINEADALLNKKITLNSEILELNDEINSLEDDIPDQFGLKDAELNLQNLTKKSNQLLSKYNTGNITEEEYNKHKEELDLEISSNQRTLTDPN